jgi:hypothetical protein
MDTIEAVISRVKKLLDRAANTDSEHEAAQAAVRARDLMAAYHLEQAEVEAFGGQVEPDPIVEEIGADIGVRRVPWKHSLATVVARLNGCHVWSHISFEGGKRRAGLRFYGRLGDVQAANYTVGYLWSEVERLTQEAARAAVTRGDRRWRNSFCMGVVARLSERVDAIVGDREQAVKQGVDSGSKALVVLARHQQEVEEGYQAVRKSKKMRTMGSGTRLVRDGYDSGRAAGDSVHLGQARGALPAIQRKLGSR